MEKVGENAHSKQPRLMSVHERPAKRVGRPGRAPFLLANVSGMDWMPAGRAFALRAGPVAVSGVPSLGMPGDRGRLSWGSFNGHFGAADSGRELDLRLLLENPPVTSCSAPTRATPLVHLPMPRFPWAAA